LRRNSGEKNDVPVAPLFPDAPLVADGQRGPDDDNSGGIEGLDIGDDLLDVAGIEEVGDRVLVGRRGDHDLARVLSGLVPVE
jgi:hypothetical protein